MSEKSLDTLLHSQLFEFERERLIKMAQVTCRDSGLESRIKSTCRDVLSSGMDVFRREASSTYAAGDSGSRRIETVVVVSSQDSNQFSVARPSTPKWKHHVRFTLHLGAEQALPTRRRRHHSLALRGLQHSSLSFASASMSKQFQFKLVHLGQYGSHLVHEISY